MGLYPVVLLREAQRKLLGGRGFGSSTGCPYSGPFTQIPCSLAPIAEEVMTRLVNILSPSVRDAREWLKKTEVHLKEEGKGSFIPGKALGLGVLGSADFQVNLKWGCL